MHKIDEDVRNAVVNCIKHNGNWSDGATSVTKNADAVEVSYRENVIFSYNTKTDKFWINDCGWPTRTSCIRINDCLEACDLPYMTYISKGCFCIRNNTSKIDWICGDGKIDGEEIVKQTMLTAEKFFS